jgi:hypothetical protein
MATDNNAPKAKTPLGGPDWTPEQWEAFDKAETEKEKSHDEFAKIVHENNWGVGGESDSELNSDSDENSDEGEDADSDKA